jgi:hypothetical protein
MNECNVEAWWEYDEVGRILEARTNRGRVSGANRYLLKPVNSQ